MKSWPSVLKDICMAEHPEIQRRGMIAVANMIESSKEVASEVVAVSLKKFLQGLLKRSMILEKLKIDSSEKYKGKSNCKNEFDIKFWN